MTRFHQNWSTFDVAALPYAAFYCEENVWQLSQSTLLPTSITSRQAVFISNRKRAVPMWNQRAAVIDPIIWDYHVVLLADGVVVDLDCRAGAVLPLAAWVDASFRSFVGADAQPRFRIVDAPDFQACFSSDRSHMQHGVSSQPQPPWPAPWNPALGMNLMRFVDVDDDIAGVVCDLPGLLANIGVPK